jgi:hypothetical protein
MVSKNIQEKKQMKKYFSFIIYNYCFFSINMIEKLIDFPDINFNTIHYLLINFITNIYILCLTNNIQLDKVKVIIDEGCMIIFDYLTISREECLNTNTYKIKYNDAIHFAYQKMHSKINIIAKEQGSIINNLKPMNTNKNLGLIIDGINLIKSIFSCLFKLQFTKTTKIIKYIDGTYYQSTIALLKANAILYVTTESIFCKKIDKLHKQISALLFYNVDIIEHFIINLIPDILSCIKSSDFAQSIYNIYFGYLTEYYCKLEVNNQVQNPTLPLTNTYQNTDYNVFVIIILLVQQHHYNNISVSQLPYTVLIDKYYFVLQNINYDKDCEKIFKVHRNQLTIEHLFITDNYKQLFI